MAIIVPPVDIAPHSSFHNAIIEMKSPSMSSFDGYFSPKKPDIFNLSHQKEEAFLRFIERRTNYLESLKNLPENWISGNCKKPSYETIKNSKSVLNLIKLFLINHEIFQETEIIMSPTPEGGVAFQIDFNDDFLVINIKDTNLDFELCKDDFFTELNSINISNTVDFIKSLGHLING